MAGKSQNDELELDFGDASAGSDAAVPARTEASSLPPDEPVERDKPLTDEFGPLKGMIDDNFLQYASYVICERAIPNLYDGLKPAD